MAEVSIFWPTNNTGDGTGTGYTMGKMVDWLRRTFVSDNPATQGVLPGYNNELAVSGVASPVSVATGAAYVYGFPYENDAAVTVAIPTPVGNTRIDRVVLRADWTAQTVRITRLPGAEGTGSPPAITQTPNTTWDLKLAQVSITTGAVVTVTDERDYCHFATKVATENLDDLAVTTAKLAAGAVTDAKIDTVAGSKVTGSVDGVDISAHTAGTAKAQHDGGAGDHSHASAGSEGGQIGTAGLANDAVDNTKVGNRVPQMPSRLGNDATAWLSPGSTTQSVGMLRMTGGYATCTLPAGPGYADLDITFPSSSFSQAPFVFIEPLHIHHEGGNFGTAYRFSIKPASSTIWVSSTGFSVRLAGGTGDSGHVDFCWLAIGPE